MTGPRCLTGVVLATLLSLPACDVTRDETRNQQWQTYGNNNGSTTDWTGADGAHSVPIGGGKVVWFFGDTYQGTINTATNPVSRQGGAHPDHATVSNTFVIQTNGQPGVTLRNPLGSHVVDGTLVHFWPRDGLVEGGKLKVLAGRTSGAAAGPYLATFSLPDLTLENFRSTPLTSSARPITWGINLYTTPSYTYIYGGTTPGLNQVDTFVARVPAGNVLASPQFRTASEAHAWSPNEADAAPMAHVLDGDVAQYAWGPDKYVMVGKDGTAHVFSEHLAAYVADTPHGPWSRVGPIYSIPEYRASDGPISYATHFHQEDITGAGMLFSYSLCQGQGCDRNGQDAALYRPRFLRMKPSSTSRNGAVAFRVQKATPALLLDEFLDPRASMADRRTR